MYKKYLLAVVVFMMLCTSCSKPTIDTIQEDQENQLQKEKDTTEVPMSNSARPVTVDFPILVKELSLLLHPIITMRVSNQHSPDKSISSSLNYKYDKAQYGRAKRALFDESFSLQGTLEYNTHVNNIVFEKLTPDLSRNDDLTEEQLVAEKYALGTRHKLFDHNDFLITKVFYPHTQTTRSTVCYDKDKTQEFCDDIYNYDPNVDTNRVVVRENIINIKMFEKFIYQVQEQQLNSTQKAQLDGNLHTHQSLYMSDENGKNMHKLHAHDQYITHTKWMPELNRYYFTTKKDSNVNKMIDETDKQFNYFIDFNSPDPKAMGYTPF